MTSRTPKSACINCGHQFEAATGADNDDRPAPGDLSICFRCGAVGIYTDDLTVRGMTEAEMDRLCNDAQMMRYLAGLVSTIQLMPKLN